MLLTFILSPLISIALANVFRTMIDIDFDISGLRVDKGNHLNIDITVKNRFFLPSPAIRVIFEDNYNIIGEDKDICFYVGARSVSRHSSLKKAVIAGGSLVKIKEIRVFDYFGLYSYSYNSNVLKKEYILGIIPEMFRINDDDYIVKAACAQSVDDGDNEDTLDETTLFFGGFPGYEYREYQPGDPLKRINQKLSAKQDKLMVRLDEKRVISKVYMIIDPCSAPNKRVNPDMYNDLPHEEQESMISENTLETSLGLIQALILKDFGVNVFLWKDETFEEYRIFDESGIAELSKAMADYRFNKNTHAQRIPEEVKSAAGSAIIYCTPFLDNELNQMLCQLNEMNSGKITAYIGSLTEGRKI